MDDYYIIAGIMIPFIGTSMGAGAVFFMRKRFGGEISPVLTGVTSGVMMAAAIWSLLLPSIEMSGRLGKLAFIPAASGFLSGVAFLLFLDRLVPSFLKKMSLVAGGDARRQRMAMMVFAITLHNIPEGMAVGVAFSGGTPGFLAGAFLLSLGIAIQNIPEGAIISMPLCGSGKSRFRAFVCGVLSGLVEPAGAVVTILLTRQIERLLAYLLAFAAGAMVYVIVEELVPESSGSHASGRGTIGFALGFVLMMTLDVAFG